MKTEAPYPNVADRRRFPLTRLCLRLLREVKWRLLWHLAWKALWKGRRTLWRYGRGLRYGEMAPAFLFISVTNRCNLRCQGCWVTPAASPADMPAETLDRVLSENSRRGSHFVGVLGGEPLLYPPLLTVLARHPDCYFQLFTNGMELNAVMAAALARLGNVSPLISIEGDSAVSDVRRGGHAVYERAFKALAACRAQGLFTGVATSVCKTNIESLATEGFLQELAAAGVHYVWYYLYRPAGPQPCPELALDDDDIRQLRAFMVEARCHLPLMIVDSCWDHDGFALCPAAIGLSHHINPAGDIEPCAPIQFAVDQVGDGRDLATILRDSQFLRHFRTVTRNASRGCILLENPHLLFDVMAADKARDTTGRGTGYEELAAMQPRPGQYQPGHEIPEKHPFYRFAKRHWFFGFGAYG